MSNSTSTSSVSVIIGGKRIHARVPSPVNYEFAILDKSKTEAEALSNSPLTKAAWSSLGDMAPDLSRSASSNVRRHASEFTWVGARFRFDGLWAYLVRAHAITWMTYVVSRNRRREFCYILQSLLDICHFRAVVWILIYATQEDTTYALVLRIVAIHYIVDVRLFSYFRKYDLLPGNRVQLRKLILQQRSYDLDLSISAKRDFLR